MSSPGTASLRLFNTISVDPIDALRVISITINSALHVAVILFVCQVQSTPINVRLTKSDLAHSLVHIAHLFITIPALVLTLMRAVSRLQITQVERKFRASALVLTCFVVCYKF
jgi:hypothetical protein